LSVDGLLPDQQFFCEWLQLERRHVLPTPCIRHPVGKRRLLCAVLMHVLHVLLADAMSAGLLLPDSRHVWLFELSCRHVLVGVRSIERGCMCDVPSGLLLPCRQHLPHRMSGRLQLPCRKHHLSGMRRLELLPDWRRGGPAVSTGLHVRWQHDAEPVHGPDLLLRRHCFGQLSGWHVLVVRQWHGELDRLCDVPGGLLLHGLDHVPDVMCTGHVLRERRVLGHGMSDRLLLPKRQRSTDAVSRRLLLRQQHIAADTVHRGQILPCGFFCRDVVPGRHVLCGGGRERRMDVSAVPRGLLLRCGHGDSDDLRHSHVLPERQFSAAELRCRLLLSAGQQLAAGVPERLLLQRRGEPDTVSSSVLLCGGRVIRHVRIVSGRHVLCDRVRNEPRDVHDLSSGLLLR
jgi:hypothetical protein